MRFLHVAAALVALALSSPALVACSDFDATTVKAADGTVTTGPSLAAQRLATVNAVVLPDGYKLGCAAVSIAHGDFQAAAPALVASGKLSVAAIATEKTIFDGAESRCASPPADLVAAGADLAGDASAIFLLMATPK